MIIIKLQLKMKHIGVMKPYQLHINCIRCLTVCGSHDTLHASAYNASNLDLLVMTLILKCMIKHPSTL